MPTYEYKCNSCDHTFELFQSMTADPVTKCPECSGTVKRLIGAGAGIIFKGSGFYCTDYKQPAQKSSPASACDSCCGADKKECPKAE
ncbi:MAG: FmdB family zinc ribbon protein [Candidatus Auribacterota bacterium]